MAASKYNLRNKSNIDEDTLAEKIFHKILMSHVFLENIAEKISE